MTGMDARDMHALSLLAQLQRLATDDPAETAVRITIRSADGDYIGEARLPETAALEATNALSVVADYVLADDTLADSAISCMLADVEQVVEVDKESLAKGKRELLARMDQMIQQGAVPDPLLVADIEDLFDAVDPQSYLADVIAADSPEAAQAAYEQLVTGEWDGDL